MIRVRRKGSHPRPLLSPRKSRGLLREDAQHSSRSLAMSGLEQVVAMVHLLAAAGWFGALVYRAFYVDPRALRFFGQTDGYEQFSLALAERMRWVVMAAMLTSGL